MSLGFLFNTTIVASGCDEHARLHSFPLSGTPGRGLGRGVKRAPSQTTAFARDVLAANTVVRTSHTTNPSPPPSPRSTVERERASWIDQKLLPLMLELLQRFLPNLRDLRWI